MHTFSNRTVRLRAQNVKRAYKASRVKCGETRSLEAQQEASLSFSVGPTEAEWGTTYYITIVWCPNKQHIWQVRQIIFMLSYFGCQDDTVNHFSDTIWQTPYFCPFLAKAANTCMHVHIHPLLTLFMASFLSFSLSQILLSTVIGQSKYLMEDRLTGKTESVCKILKQQLVKHWNWKNQTTYVNGFWNCYEPPTFFLKSSYGSLYPTLRKTEVDYSHAIV